MNSKIKISFYKSLLYSDFFLSKYSFAMFRNKSKQFLPRFKAYQKINLWELLKNFKRFIFLIKFNFSQQQNKILLTLSNPFHFSLLTYFFKAYPLEKARNFLSFNDNLQILSKESLLSFKSPYKVLHCLVDIPSKKIVKNCEKLINLDVFLFSILNVLKSNFQIGFYNVNIEFTDFKKVMFLILLLNKIFIYFSFFKDFLHVK